MADEVKVEVATGVVSEEEFEEQEKKAVELLCGAISGLPLYPVLSALAAITGTLMGESVKPGREVSAVYHHMKQLQVWMTVAQAKRKEGGEPSLTTMPKMGTTVQ